MRGRSGLLLELKDPSLYPGIERQVAEELEAGAFSQPAPAADRLVVQSFDHASVRRYHELQPRVAVGELYLRRPTEAESVNEPEDMRRMISIGVDGIITDFPGTLDRVRAR